MNDKEWTFSSQDTVLSTDPRRPGPTVEQILVDQKKWREERDARPSDIKSYDPSKVTVSFNGVELKGFTESPISTGLTPDDDMVFYTIGDGGLLFFEPRILTRRQEIRLRSRARKKRRGY